MTPYLLGGKSVVHLRKVGDVQLKLWLLAPAMKSLEPADKLVAEILARTDFKRFSARCDLRRK